MGVTAELQAEVDQLRQAMIGMAPFDFVKLGHHGSFNACSEDLLTAYNDTIEYGICVGEFSKTHPDPDKVLPLLAARSRQIQWLRTDYNRLCGFTWSAAGGVEFFKEAGRLNDTRKNEFDLGGRLAGVGGGEDRILPAVERVIAPSAQSAFPLARFESTIPFGDGSVSFQFTVVPPSLSRPASRGMHPSAPSPLPPARGLGGGAPGDPAAGPPAVGAPVQPPHLADASCPSCCLSPAQTRFGETSAGRKRESCSRPSPTGGMCCWAICRVVSS